MLKIHPEKFELTLPVFWSLIGCDFPAMKIADRSSLVLSVFVVPIVCVFARLLLQLRKKPDVHECMLLSNVF